MGKVGKGVNGKVEGSDRMGIAKGKGEGRGRGRGTEESEKGKRGDG